MAGCGSARGQRPLPDRRISEADAPVWRWVPGAAGPDRPRRQPWLEFRISRYAKWSHDKPQASPWKAAKPTGRQTTGPGPARLPGAAESRRQGAPRHRYLDDHDAGRDRGTGGETGVTRYGIWSSGRGTGSGLRPAMPTSKANSGGPDQHLTNALKDNICSRSNWRNGPSGAGARVMRAIVVTCYLNSDCCPLGTAT